MSFGTLILLCKIPRPMELLNKRPPSTNPAHLFSFDKTMIDDGVCVCVHENEVGGWRWSAAPMGRKDEAKEMR